jgi:hypothetical protein
MTVTSRPSTNAAAAAPMTPNAGRFDVPITIAGRSALTCVFPGQRSVRSRVDNCYRDQAVTNARQLADLLAGADAAVVSPDG